MPGSNMNVGLNAGPNLTWCGVGSVLGPDFEEILTPPIPILLWFRIAHIKYAQKPNQYHVMIFVVR